MDPKEFLLRHFEKLVLGGFGAWLVFMALGPVIWRPKELDENEKLTATIDNIKHHMEGYKVELPKIEDPTSELQAQLDASKVPAVEEFPHWLAHRRPSLAIAVAAGQAKVVPKHEAPTDFHVADKGRGRVKLAWKVSGENEYINITGYEVFRRDNSETAEWKSIQANIDPNKTEWEDSTVGPRSRYWYRLKESAVAQLDNPVISRDKTDLAADRRDLYADDTKEAVETPQDVYITIDGGEAVDPVNNVKGQVQLKVWRWNSVLGKFVSKPYLSVPVGQKIGGKEKKVRFEGKVLEEVTSRPRPPSPT